MKKFNFKKKYLVGVSLALLCSTIAHSYPIVSEAEKISLGKILTLYPDHEDSSKVYFFPNSSMIARDQSNLPMFGLTTWGLKDSTFRPANAGAWMTFTARLTSDPLQQKALELYLKNNPSKRLAVIPVKKSTIGIRKSGDQTKAPFSNLISEMSMSNLGGNAEDEIGFMGTLTGIGAKVFKEVVKKPDVFKMYYCYSFDGAGPDMDAKITVDFKKIYTHFKAVTSVGYWWFSTNINYEVKKLVQNGTVKIVINGGNAKDEEYIRKIALDISKRLFVPEIQNGDSGAQLSGNPWDFVRLSVGSFRSEELKTETWQYTRRDLVERKRCLPVNVRDIKNYYDQLVSDS